MRTDILLDENYDLFIEDGDFSFGASAEQETEQIILSLPGEWKQNPLTGFGIDNYLKQRAGSSPVINSLPQFVRDLKLQLEADGFIDPEITVNDDLSNFNIAVNQ